MPGFVLLAIAACAEPSGPAPIDTIPTPVIGPDTVRAVERFGRYHAEIHDTTPPALPTDTPDGPFVTIATSSAGDRVGKVQDRFSIWLAGAPAPSYMFRADTVLGTLFAHQINTRGEVVFSGANQFASTQPNVRFWRAGSHKVVITQACRAGVGPLNNRGILLTQDCASLYRNYLTVSSPYSPETTPSARFAGKTCSAGGRYSDGIAINDSNELLVSVESALGQNAPVVLWLAGGCVNLGGAFPGIIFNVLGANGLVGGYRDADFDVAVITNGTHLARVDDLLDDAPGQPAWHILSVKSIDANQVIIAQAIRIADSRVFTVKLTPVP